MHPPLSSFVLSKQSHSPDPVVLLQILIFPLQEENEHGKFFLDDNYCGRHIDSDELEEELKKLGYKVQQVTVCSNNNGYFSILRVEQEEEVSYLAVVSLDGEPICVGTVTLMIDLPFKQ